MACDLSLSPFDELREHVLTDAHGMLRGRIFAACDLIGKLAKRLDSLDLQSIEFGREVPVGF
jgi:hypothetical protein